MRLGHKNFAHMDKVLGRCFIGTSGWSYAHWGGGRFYPKGLDRGKWLPFLAEHFDTVEVNSTFYRLPEPEVVRRWRQAVGRHFRFAVKLWRQVTHLKQLSGAGLELRQFLEAVRPLRPRHGALLVQLPPSLSRNLALLDEFLGEFGDAMGRSRWPVAVEFRHPDWIDDSVYSLLDRYGAAVVLADMPRCHVSRPNAAGFVYVRRHGPGGRYRGCYPPSAIAEDARKVRAWLAEGREVFVYFNNDLGGHALDNARQLVAEVQRCGRAE